MKAKKIAVVTGASAGLGSEFALAIDASDLDLDEIWLIARRLAPMENLASRFKRVKGVAIALDLASHGAGQALDDRMTEAEVDVRLFINNAGFGKVGAFRDLGLREQLEMIDVNCRAVTELAFRALARMSNGSALINVASSIAYAPAPNFAVYAATKAYALSFSEALGFESAPRGIRVMAVCPGPVRTEFFDVAGKSETRPGETAPQPNALTAIAADAKAVVAKAMSDLARGKTVSIYGASIKAFAALAPFVPKSIAMRAIAGRRPQTSSL